MKSSLSNYWQLMKPSIMLLVLVTGAASLIMEGSLLGDPIGFGLVLLGLMLTGGSANAFNMYFERDIDALMNRTSKRRPLPLGLITPRNALIFAIAIGILSVAIFWQFFNLISVLAALGTIVFYAFFYTLYLKPRTKYNIVIGGAAGSMAPIIAWLAATGSITAAPLIMFGIIFLWTPPHFWSLALFIKKDYEIVNYPMMPVISGEHETKRQIVIYTASLGLFSVLLFFAGAGYIYSVIAVVTGIIFMKKSIEIYRSRVAVEARGLFGYSIIYLFILFAGIAFDSVIQRII